LPDLDGFTFAFTDEEGRGGAIKVNGDPTAGNVLFLPPAPQVFVGGSISNDVVRVQADKVYYLTQNSEFIPHFRPVRPPRPVSIDIFQRADDNRLARVWTGRMD